jgi:hypothetical protein
MDSLSYIIKKYNLDMSQELPICIPNTDRNRLAKLFYELGYKEGAEIGIAEASYSFRLFQKNPNLFLHCIDCWKEYEGYDDMNKQETYSKSEEKAREVLKQYNSNIIKKFSMDAVKDFKDESLDFVYIDANHDLQNVINDITEWSKKVRKGGIVSGHDYVIANYRNADGQVVYALQAFTKANEINPWFVLGREEIISGERRESSRSWLFVK